jgi:hypothetical protein
MTGDRTEPTLNARLEALGCRLAAAFDINAVLAARRQIVELFGESLAISPRRRRDHVELRHRMRALKRQAGIVAGELLLSLRARGLRRGGGGDQKTTAGRARPSLASLGFAQRTMPDRWQARARAAPSRSFNVRVAEATTIADIKALIAEATLSRRGEKQKGRAARGIAAARRLGARRKGGALLLAGIPSELGAGSTGMRWKKLARLNEQEFLREIEDASKAAMACHGSVPVPQITIANRLRHGRARQPMQIDLCRRRIALGAALNF